MISVNTITAINNINSDKSGAPADDVVIVFSIIILVAFVIAIIKLLNKRN